MTKHCVCGVFVVTLGLITGNGALAQAVQETQVDRLCENAENVMRSPMREAALAMQSLQKDLGVDSAKVRNLVARFADVQQKFELLAGARYPACKKVKEIPAKQADLFAGAQRLTDLRAEAIAEHKRLEALGCDGGGVRPKEVADRCNPLVEAFNSRYPSALDALADTLNTRRADLLELIQQARDELDRRYTEIGQSLQSISDEIAALKNSGVKAALAELDKLIAQLRPLR